MKQAVQTRSEQNFWLSVPSRGNIFCQDLGALLTEECNRSGQSKVAKLNMAFRVEQNITGFHVPMQKLAGMQEFESLTNRPTNELIVNFERKQNSPLGIDK